MALSGSFYNYPVKSFGLYCEWSASQSVTGNYSNVTLKVYLSYWDLYVGARDDGVINIAGNSSNFSTAAISESSSGWKKKLIAQKTVTVYHDGNGNANCYLGASWRFSGTYSGTSIGTITAEQTVSLDKLDRSAPSISISVSDITANSVKLSASASATCDIWDYTTNNWGSYKQYSTSAGTSNSITITGLSPNTSYTIAVRARKQYNHVVGSSGTKTIKTLGGSVLSSVSALTADNATAKITLSATVYDTSYKHKLVLKDGGTTVLTLTGLSLSNGSNTITLTAAQRSYILADMAAKKSFTGTFELSTFSGSSQIGSTSTKTATVQTTSANSAPTFTAFTFEDSNATAVGVTGNNQILIQNISTLKLTLTAATAKNGATISSYSVVAGSKTASGTTTTIMVGTLPDKGTVPVIVTAIDSRGYTTAVTVNITVLEYEGINITEYTMRRVNEVEDTTQVTIGGDITPVTIGGTNKNSLRYLYYRYRKTSNSAYNSYKDITSSTEYDDSGFNFESDEWLSLDADYSYYVQFLVTDKLTSDTVTITVPQGTPLLALRRKKVGINKREPAAALDVDGSVMMNGFNVLGLVATLDGSEDLNNLVAGGIYTQAANANASTAKHYPKAIAGFLEVMANPSGYIMQRYTAYDNSAVYVRTRYNNTWYAWKSVTLTTV